MTIVNDTIKGLASLPIPKGYSNGVIAYSWDDDARRPSIHLTSDLFHEWSNGHQVETRSCEGFYNFRKSSIVDGVEVFCLIKTWEGA